MGASYPTPQYLSWPPSPHLQLGRGAARVDAEHCIVAARVAPRRAGRPQSRQSPSRRHGRPRPPAAAAARGRTRPQTPRPSCLPRWLPPPWCSRRAVRVGSCLGCRHIRLKPKTLVHMSAIRLPCLLAIPRFSCPVPSLPPPWRNLRAFCIMAGRGLHELRCCAPRFPLCWPPPWCSLGAPLHQALAKPCSRQRHVSRPEPPRPSSQITQ